MSKEIFVLRWTNYDGGIISEAGVEFVVKPTLREALMSIGRRCHQSQHLIPDNAAGFYLTPREFDTEY